MRRNLVGLKVLVGLVWAVFLSLTSCHTAYEVVKVEGGCLAVDSTWDNQVRPEVMALLAPYQAKVDSTMSQVLGTAAISMDRARPESPLSNLVADVLREAAVIILGKPADMGLVNIGGIRNSLTRGSITMENVYEILPFENVLCVLTLRGNVLRQLFENIAIRGGEGVSGVRLEISRDGKLLNAWVGDCLLEDEKEYSVATVDYLAEGNDGMVALREAEDRVCPPGLTLRSLFIRYVENKTKVGQKVSACMEGRITVK